MMKRFTALLMTLLFLSFSLSILAQDQPGPAPVGQRPDAPTYALHGPYWVGTRTIEMDKGTANALRFTVWYPALNPEGLEESTVYQMSENHILRLMLPADADVPYTVLGHALENAAPDLSAAPYPLVINSHAFTAQMWQMYLGEHLASYGFVVIAPEHAHDDWSNLYPSIVTRMLEMTRTIKDAETLNAPDGVLADMIDVERIAVGGHSAGGMASYGAAGAPVDWTQIKKFCTAVPDDPGCIDINFDAQYQQIIQLPGVEVGTDGLLSIPWDARVDAIFPMAGSMEMPEQRGLASITVPIMTLFGSVDSGIPWFTPAYSDVSSEKKAQVVFTDAGHGVFYNQCDVFPYIVDYDLYWGCSDSVWDLARTQDLTNHFVTAFLLDVLKDDKDAHAALAPDAVSFPGVEYESQGF